MFVVSMMLVRQLRSAALIGVLVCLAICFASYRAVRAILQLSAHRQSYTTANLYAAAAARAREWEEHTLLARSGLTRRDLSLLLTDRDFDSNDYDTLLALDANNVMPKAYGASEGQIRRLPEHVVEHEGMWDSETGKTRACPICLEQYKKGDRLRTLLCLHQFHCDCVDPWLRTNCTCPVCKFQASE